MGVAVAIDDERSYEPASILKAGGDEPVEVEIVLLSEMIVDPPFSGPCIPANICFLGLQETSGQAARAPRPNSSSRPDLRPAITRSDPRAMG